MHIKVLRDFLITNMTCNLWFLLIMFKYHKVHIKLAGLGVIPTVAISVYKDVILKISIKLLTFKPDHFIDLLSFYTLDL